MFVFYSSISFLLILIKIWIFLNIHRGWTKIKSLKKTSLYYFGSHSSFVTMSLEVIVTFTWYSTFLLVFKIWNFHLYLLSSSYWHRISTVVWCSYLKCWWCVYLNQRFCCEIYKETSILCSTYVLLMYYPPTHFPKLGRTMLSPQIIMYQLDTLQSFVWNFRTCRG